MSKKCRTAVFSYVPNNGTSDPGRAFAVFAVGEHAAALVGINLSQLGITHKNPTAQGLFNETVDLVHQRILDAIKESNPNTGYDLLKKVVAQSVTSIVCTSVSKSTTPDAWRAAWEKYRQAIGKEVSAVPRNQGVRPMMEVPRWRETLPVTSRALEFAEAR